MSRYTVAIGLAIEGAALVFALSLCRAASRADQQRAGHHAELQVRAEPLAVASQTRCVPPGRADHAGLRHLDSGSTLVVEELSLRPLAPPPA